MTPAFVDAHIHATDTGIVLLGLDLAGTRSAADVLDRVASHAADLPADAVVVGHGWDESSWSEQTPPSAAELDRAGGGRSVYLSQVSVHSAVVSTALLERAPASTPGWDGGGWLRRDAHHVVREIAMGAISTAQRRLAQRAALQPRRIARHRRGARVRRPRHVQRGRLHAASWRSGREPGHARRVRLLGRARRRREGTGAGCRRCRRRPVRRRGARLADRASPQPVPRSRRCWLRARLRDRGAGRSAPDRLRGARHAGRIPRDRRRRDRHRDGRVRDRGREAGRGTRTRGSAPHRARRDCWTRR